MIGTCPFCNRPLESCQDTNEHGTFEIWVCPAWCYRVRFDVMPAHQYFAGRYNIITDDDWSMVDMYSAPQHFEFRLPLYMTEERLRTLITFS